MQQFIAALLSLVTYMNNAAQASDMPPSHRQKKVPECLVITSKHPSVGASAQPLQTLNFSSQNMTPPEKHCWHAKVSNAVRIHCGLWEVVLLISDLVGIQNNLYCFCKEIKPSCCHVILIYKAELLFHLSLSSISLGRYGSAASTLP